MERMINIEELPISDQQMIRDIIAGKILPPLYADAIAKKILNADVHPDRLNFLMRSIAKDTTIDVASSAGNENFKQSVHSKSIGSETHQAFSEPDSSRLERACPTKED